MDGPRVLVDVAEYDSDKDLRVEVNFLGIYLGVGKYRGKPTLVFERLPERVVVEIPGAPVDLWPAEKDGAYTLRRTGEVVENLDFIVERAHDG